MNRSSATPPGTSQRIPKAGVANKVVSPASFMPPGLKDVRGEVGGKPGDLTVR